MPHFEILIHNCCATRSRRYRCAPVLTYYHVRSVPVLAAPCARAARDVVNQDFRARRHSRHAPRIRREGIKILGLAFSLALLGSTDLVAAHEGLPPIGELIGRVQQTYERSKDIKGKFKQVYSDPLYGSTRTSYGYLFVKKPGMMRWNYASPERKAFISDGKVLWVWEPEQNQAFRNPLDKSTLSTGLSFLLGAGKLSSEFEIAYASGKDEALTDLAAQRVGLKLTPRTPTAHYEHLLFVVRLTDYAVVETHVVGRNSTNHFTFSKLVFDSKLGKKRFRFKPPSETRIIDTQSAPAR